MAQFGVGWACWRSVSSQAVRIPVDLAARVAMSGRRPHSTVEAPVVWPPPMTLRQIRQEAAALLPGSKIRHLFYWRYLLVYRHVVESFV
jgi:hypothetical protein